MKFLSTLITMLLLAAFAAAPSAHAGEAGDINPKKGNGSRLAEVPAEVANF